MSELPGFGAFSACVGERFRLIEDGGEIVAELVEAKPLGKVPDRPFTLLFRVPDGPLLPQRTYPFEHENLGHFELFIVPVGSDDVGMRYEAIFT